MTNPDTPLNSLRPSPGAPAQRALAAAGYAHLEQIADASAAELLKLHGMGPKALGILRDALAVRGLALRHDS